VGTKRATLAQRLGHSNVTGHGPPNAPIADPAISPLLGSGSAQSRLCDASRMALLSHFPAIRHGREVHLKSKIELLPHDPSWASMAMAEANRLAHALGDNLLDVQHIGSTAITGLKAKATIDPMPRVRSLAALDARSDEVGALGYRWREEFGIPGRRYCTRDASDQRDGSRAADNATRAIQAVLCAGALFAS
jgi:hypothetical protein